MAANPITERTFGECASRCSPEITVDGKTGLPAMDDGGVLVEEKVAEFTFPTYTPSEQHNYLGWPLYYTLDAVPPPIQLDRGSYIWRYVRGAIYDPTSGYRAIPWQPVWGGAGLPILSFQQALSNPAISSSGDYFLNFDVYDEPLGLGFYYSSPFNDWVAFVGTPDEIVTWGLGLGHTHLNYPESPSARYAVASYDPTQLSGATSSKANAQTATACVGGSFYHAGGGVGAEGGWWPGTLGSSPLGSISSPVWAVYRAKPLLKFARLSILNITGNSFTGYLFITNNSNGIWYAIPGLAGNGVSGAATIHEPSAVYYVNLNTFAFAPKQMTRVKVVWTAADCDFNLLISFDDRSNGATNLPTLSVPMRPAVRQLGQIGIEGPYRAGIAGGPTWPPLSPTWRWSLTMMLQNMAVGPVSGLARIKLVDNETITWRAYTEISLTTGIKGIGDNSPTLVKTWDIYEGREVAPGVRTIRVEGTIEDRGTVLRSFSQALALP